MDCDIIRKFFKDFIGEALSPETEDIVNGHVSGCESCQKALEHFRATGVLPIDKTSVFGEKDREAYLAGSSCKGIKCVLWGIILFLLGSLFFVFMRPASYVRSSYHPRQVVDYGPVINASSPQMMVQERTNEIEETLSAFEADVLPEELLPADVIEPLFEPIDMSPGMDMPQMEEEVAISEVEGVEGETGAETHE